MKSKKLYPIKNGRPQMVPSFVCYADILGYVDLSNNALQTGNEGEFLERLKRALSNAYSEIRGRAKGWEDQVFFKIKIFTDNIVVGYPLSKPEWDYGEPELADIMFVFAEVQLSLALEGFFLRGGISFGPHYMDKDLVFGSAFVEAVALDKSGGAPRLTFSESAVTLIRKQMAFYGEEPEWTPHSELLLQDADGSIFLNYLDHAFQALADGGIYFDLIEGHRNTIIEGLETYKGHPGIRSKYEWAAHYHNFVCRDNADRHPVPSADDFDEDTYFEAEEAQKLKEYLIDLSSYATEPQRIEIRPIPLDRTPSESNS